MPEPTRPDSLSSRRPSRWSWPLGLGLLAFVIGAGLAVVFLPEWRPGRLRGEEVYVQQFRERATRAGWWLAPGEPRVRLTSWNWHYALFHDLLGEDAAGWMDGRGAGLSVEVFHPVSRPGEEPRNLFLELTPAGRPWAAALWQRGIPEVYETEPAPLLRRAHDLSRLLLRPGERPGEAESVEELGMLWWVAKVAGTAGSPGSAAAQERLPRRLLGISGGFVWLSELPEPGEVSGRAGEAGDFGDVAGTAKRMGGILTRSWVPGAVTLAAAVLFFVLLARGRLGMLNGAILAAASLAFSDFSPTWSEGSWIMSLTNGISRLLPLFLLWSAAESLLRTHQPGFTTSLDNLRRGRLGPRAGRALLAGFGYGALLAGLYLGICALAVPIAGISPARPGLFLPFAGAGRNLWADGVLIAGQVALAAALASRALPARWAPWGAALVAGLFYPAPLLAASLASFLISLAAQAACAGLLVAALRRHGLTALLTAGITSQLLPAAVFAGLGLALLPAVFAVLAAAVLAIPLLGALGLRRPAEIEDGAPQPRFVRRLEEARRVRYETDLLVRMQSGMLPRRLPEVPGYEIAARAELATGIGGNLYTVLRDEGGHLWIASGDVEGEGYACSIAQAMIKAALRSLIAPGLLPSQVLRRTGEVLRGVDPQRNRAALALLRLDPATGDGLLANAGHPTPLLFAADRAAEVPSAGPLLGEPGDPDGPSYDDLPLRLPAGGVLVLTSETLFDEPDRDGVPFGSANLCNALREAAARPAEEILEALLRAWRRHLGGETPGDDTTVVVLKRSSRGPA